MTPAEPVPIPEEPPYRRRPATDAEARALASSLRLRILRLTLDDALSNKEIAEALGRPPASVLHHVRTLVDTGFLRPEPVRRGTRGAREIPYRATGKSWYMDTGRLAHPMLEAFLDEVRSVPPEHQDFTRLGLRLPEAEMEEFNERLFGLVQEFHDRPRDPSATPWSVFIALHPDTSQRRRPSPGREGAPR